MNNAILHSPSIKNFVLSVTTTVIGLTLQISTVQIFAVTFFVKVIHTAYRSQGRLIVVPILQTSLTQLSYIKLITSIIFFNMTIQSAGNILLCLSSVSFNHVVCSEVERVTGLSISNIPDLVHVRS